MKLYKSVDGRFYETEYFPSGSYRPHFIPSRETKQKELREQTVRTKLQDIEVYLGYEPSNYDEMIRIYHLSAAKKGKPYLGDPKEVFTILCERYPEANNYESLNDLYWSMKGDQPLRKCHG